MTNLKNVLVTSGLMLVFTVGASTVNAGVIIVAKADKDPNSQSTSLPACKEEAKTFFAKLGIILTDLKGVLVGDDTPPVEECKTEPTKYGLLVSD